ncbi:retrovirus-related Pol polyprotein from transposon 17.6 [Trichonephila clavipes]|nr:retrovirus-related Pol polyprotein from transposon 17.6 [Trichonephila clavipes]
MSTLNDYPKISQSLKSSSTNNIKILHRLIFGENGDRKNRSRLREFSGFPTDFNVEETKTKIIKEFTLKELIAVCNLLHLEFTTELESCCDIILTHLCDLTLFKSTVLNSGSESDLELNEKSPPENRHSQPITSDSASNDLRSENMKSLDLNDLAQNLLPLFDKQTTCNSFLSFNLRDLLELVKPFTSRDSYSIETFISDIEDIFRLYQITNPIHQIIFVKKCLKGPAENLIRSIRGITNWSQMKEHLLNEFSDRINSAQLHNMMQARRLKPTETLQEYFLTMRDLAHKGIGRDRVESKGYFKNFITIQNTALPAKIHVVNDETIPLDAIIGIDFLQQTQFTFGRDGIRIFRDVDECKNDDVLRDLLIPSQNEAEGLNKLRLVLQTAADFGLELNLKKCNFLQRKNKFLGYIIENGTIKPSPSKTQAVQNFPQPQTPRQLQSFIGLTSYFRKFIPNYARIARPLSDLLRDIVKFKFGPTEIASFQELKNILSENPVLRVFQQGYPLELHTDASSLGFGAVLLQKSDDGLFHPLYPLF